MFTVVIAEKEHLNNIDKYRFFLNPFFDDDKVTFCEWNKDEGKLFDAVPGLLKAITGKQQWRLLLVADDRNIKKQNPFDRVDLQENTHEERMKAYARAIDNPIVRLVTHMCEWPLEDGGINGMENDPDYAEYLVECGKKREIRERIAGGNTIKFVLPDQILCLARRTYKLDKEYMHDVWMPHYEEQYSTFAERNMYFDKMRYLLFDIEDTVHSEYGYEYLRFLYTLMILAQNEPPKAALKANRVYTIKSVLNKEKFLKLLDDYDKKLAATDRQIKHWIRDIEQSPKVFLTDEQAEALVSERIEIPIKTSQEVKREDVYIKPAKIGLTTDCPTEEIHVWDAGRKKSIAGMKLLIKRTRRLFQRASGHFRDFNYIENENAALMEPHQVADMRDNVEVNELKMAAIDIPNMFDGYEYEEKMDVEDVEVRQVIHNRMKKTPMILIGIISLIVFILSYIPVIMNNREYKHELINVLIAMGITLVITAIISVIVLFVQRRKLKKGIDDYNHAVDATFDEIDTALSAHSEYLGYACNVMRANAIINDYYENNNPDQRKIRIYRKHVADVLEMREGIYDAFGNMLDPGRYMDLSEVEPYNYDFRKSLDYKYPVDFNAYDKRVLTYMQAGNEILIPVSFIEKLEIEREELYD